MLRQAAPDIDVRIHGADLSRVEDQERLAQACAGIDILVNNAGSNPAGDLDDTSDKIWRNAWDLKVFGYINLTRSIFRAMKQRRDGVIVNIIGYAGERLFARYIIGSTGNARGQPSSGQSERRDILARRPWLREIGQWLRAGYDAVDQPVPERLAALLKELKGRRH
jgi:NAD(P)-dependent dehydrogenase (short-subunit alcohol dehydrogenase family)